MHRSIPAALVVLAATLPLCGETPAAFTLNGAAIGGLFSIGTQWTLSLANVLPNASFSLCVSKNGGAPGCTPSFGRTDEGGTWKLSGSFDAFATGTYAMWAQFPDTITNWINFTVGNPPPTLTINGASGGSFLANGSWNLSISGGPANTPIALCFAVFDDFSGCADYGHTDANGTWKLDGQFGDTSIGPWTLWAQFPSGAISNEITFVVSGAAIPALTINSVQDGQFAIGKNWELALSNAPRNTPVSLCFKEDGVALGCSGNRATDGNGHWEVSGTFGDSALGIWEMYAQFPSGFSNGFSNWITLAILEPDTTPPAAPTGLAASGTTVRPALLSPGTPRPIRPFPGA
jgi:hypothetical protein